MTHRTPGRWAAAAAGPGPRTALPGRASCRHTIPDAREQVVLRGVPELGRADQRAHQLVVLGRPDLALHVQRYGEPPAVRVDLRGVRLQRGVAYREVVGALDPGGHPGAG